MFLLARQIKEEWTRMLMQNLKTNVQMSVCIFLMYRHTYMCMYICMVLFRFQEPAEVASLNKTKTCKCECECFVFFRPWPDKLN